MKNNFIIGTAGHIDHGKTTLVKALTGRETDTLKEEKERGISINLGFTYMTLSNGDKAGIIDAPGHENFVKNMMAGVVGIDVILLLVAADDGVMPQTIEHAQILHYMGVDNAIIVITKKNLVDSEMLGLVEEDIRLSFENTILKDAPIIKVDSVSSEGIDELKATIEDKILNTDKAEDNKAMRMNIDRAFSLKGIGTVITGTLTEGQIEKDKDYMIYPAGRIVKIRSIENHGVPTDIAHKGQRVALNLSNISSNEIHRGDIIAESNSLIKVKNVQCDLSLSNFEDIKVEHWTRVRFFHGTKEVLARAVPLSSKEIYPGETKLCEFRLEEEIFVKRLDRFVIRSFSPVMTIGGGVIIDTNQDNHTSNTTDYVAYLESKEEFSELDEIADYLFNFRSFAEIYGHMGIDEENLRSSLNQMEKDGLIQIIGESFISTESLKDLSDTYKTYMEDYHNNHPLEEGLSKDEFRQKLAINLDNKDFEALLKNKIITKNIMMQRGIIKDKDFAINTANQEEKINDILKILKDNEPKILKETEIIDKKEDKDLLSFLLKDRLTKVDEFFLRNEYKDELTELVKKIIVDNKKLEVSEFRDQSGLSRKQAVAFLEYLDKKNITKRIDDYRVLV